MQRAENKVGGGEGVEGCYGTLTRAGVQQIMESMADVCGLSSSSVLVDIGAGIGRPLLHAMHHPGVGASWGVEIDPVKCSKGRAYVQLVVRDMAGAGLPAGGGGAAAAAPSMVCVAVERLSTLEPATHAYACWEGMPRTAKVAFGALFLASPSLQSVAVVQRAFRRPPQAAMQELGFGELDLLKTFPVHLAGSQRQLNAYIFVKPRQAAAGGLEQQQQQQQQQQQEQQRHQQHQHQQQQQGKRPRGTGNAPTALGAAAVAQPAPRARGRASRAASAAAPPAGGAPSDSSSITPLPLQQWMLSNGLQEEEVMADATSGRVRRKRRLS
ncbi:hypothetical protein MNEG_11153 [Monoraphidium neglectum]|uniref:Uncharacterized protein n=1 Tax=Monoraphidium neglectum TaxID=145388 RepID=A0A0D2LZI9_9CHLO|nr:hypothetical protein MNEG_11153 [Monoraphidium neglectum]KIY96809.1 hypothetical protein MNEG_11153 [Monoraphidium neglectum]|eukprot:XP_013895829.1 hypothetical protein MNEG_11153 [Monoraphidium neglectum]